MRRTWWALGLLAVTACNEKALEGAGTRATVSATTAVAPAAHTASGGAMKATETADAQLEAFAAKFLAEYLERNPTRATEVGEHRFDGRWPDLSVQGEDDERRYVEAQLKELARIPHAELGPQARVDHELLGNVLGYWRFSLDELRDPETDPLYYTRLVGDGIDPLVTRDFAPIEKRMASLRARLGGVPKIVEAARARLKRPAKIQTETAIQQNKGLIALCKAELAEHFAKVPAQKAELEAAAKEAAAALEQLQAFFEKELLPRSDGDFRIGRARFEKKLRFELDDQVDIDAVAQGARELLGRTQREMVETAIVLWPDLMKGKPLPPLGTPEEQKAAVRQVLDELAKEHPTNDTIIKDATASLEEATKFVRERDLVTVPKEACRIIEMPEYRRGVAIAYCDASGPLEEKQETFYAISPTPKDWPQKRVDSFYREYNKPMLHELTIHEAMPGHFLQLMHNNRFPSKVRAVFSSGPFVEGWAVYSEWLMAKHGFGGPKVKMQRQKMVLRLAANAILDHDIHAGAMDEKAALELMQKEAFQEEGEAVGKWKRARLSSAQLTTYYYGFTEMMKLRADHERDAGFSEKAYHDRLLSYGSPSMRAARALMSKP